METSIYSPDRSIIDEMRLMSEAGDLASSPSSDNESTLEGMKLMFNAHDLEHTESQEEAAYTDKKISNKENTTPLVHEKHSSTRTMEISTTKVISDRAEVSTSPIHNVAHLKNLLYQFGNENNQKKNTAAKTRSRDTPRVIPGNRRVAEMRSYLNQAEHKNSNRNNHTNPINSKVYMDVPMNKVTDMKSFLMDFEKRNKKQMSSKEFPTASKQRTIIEERMNKVTDLRNWLAQMENSKANSVGGSSDQHNFQKKSVNIPMNKVNDMKNWLLEFERQNKEHNEKHNTKNLNSVTNNFMKYTNYIPDYQELQNRMVVDASENDDDVEGNVVLKLPETYFVNKKANHVTLHQNQESETVPNTSPINSVSNLKNWLVDFERKNKEHYEKGNMYNTQRTSNQSIQLEKYLDEDETNSLSRSIDSVNKNNAPLLDQGESSETENRMREDEEETENTPSSRSEKETIYNEQEKLKEMERYHEQEENKNTPSSSINQVGSDDNSTYSDDSLTKYLDDLDHAMSNTINNEKEAALLSVSAAPTTKITSLAEATSPKTSISSTSESSNSYDNINRGIELNKIVIKRDSVSDDQCSVQSSQTKGSQNSIREKINNRLPTPRLKFKTMKKILINSAKKSSVKKITSRNGCTNPLDQVDTSSYTKVESSSNTKPMRDNSRDFHGCETQSQPTNETTKTRHNKYDFSRSDPPKEIFPDCLSPDKSITSMYEGLMSPDKSLEEEECKIATNAKRLPYKKSSKNVSEHVGWLKSVYSSPRAAPPLHPSFAGKDGRRKREARVGNGDERNLVRYLI